MNAEKRLVGSSQFFNKSYHALTTATLYTAWLTFIEAMKILFFLFV